MTEPVSVLRPVSPSDTLGALAALPEFKGREYIFDASSTLTIEQLSAGVGGVWNADAMCKGIDFLREKCANGRVFYDIRQDIAPPCLMAFPVEGAARSVLICAGGAYGDVCLLSEGFPIARRLNRLGISAFVLRYRCGRMPVPTDDLARAVEFIAENAELFGVDMGKLALMGFSAGAHLAASYAAGIVCAPTHPAYLMLAYPVVTMGEYAHAGSRENILGGDFSAESAERWSVERHVGTDFPPCYIWQCRDDDMVSSRNSLLLYGALQNAGVPSRLELVSGSAHGWGLADGTSAHGWLDRALDFWQSLDE